MDYVSSRLEFSIESYGDFSKKVSAERLLFRIMFLLYVFITNFLSLLKCLGYIKSCILLFCKQEIYKS
jgi:hypothetical protein